MIADVVRVFGERRATSAAAFADGMSTEPELMTVLGASTGNSGSGFALHEKVANLKSLAGFLFVGLF